MIRATVVALLLATAAFIVGEAMSTKLWPATNAAGIVCFGFLVFLASKIHGLIHRQFARRLVSVVLFLGLTSFVATWALSYVFSQEQVRYLSSTRLRIFHGTMISYLQPRITKAFVENRHHVPSEPLAESFRRLYPTTGSLADSSMFSDEGTVKVLYRDSTIVVTIEAFYVKGSDTAFVNADGRHGLAQHEIFLTSDGVGHVIQN